jgi:hypothetical protein
MTRSLTVLLTKSCYRIHGGSNPPCQEYEPRWYHRQVHLNPQETKTWSNSTQILCAPHHQLYIYWYIGLNQINLSVMHRVQLFSHCVQLTWPLEDVIQATNLTFCEHMVDVSMCDECWMMVKEMIKLWLSLRLILAWMWCSATCLLASDECRCWALRQSAAMEKVKRVYADGPAAVKDSHGGLDRGTRCRGRPWIANTWKRRRASVHEKIA